MEQTLEQIKEYENGDKYFGQLKDGLRHGMGKLIYTFEHLNPHKNVTTNIMKII
jgi:hypothetical protein